MPAATCKFHWLILPWEQHKLNEQLACYGTSTPKIAMPKGWGGKRKSMKNSKNNKPSKPSKHNKNRTRRNSSSKV
jgi:hypothetical protein